MAADFRDIQRSQYREIRQGWMSNFTCNAHHEARVESEADRLRTRKPKAPSGSLHSEDTGVKWEEWERTTDIFLGTQEGAGRDAVGDCQQDF